MTFNHLVGILHPGQSLFWYLLWLSGAMTAPIMIYLMVESFFKTHSQLKYGLRLFLFAIISQIPFAMAFHTTVINFIGTLFLAFCVFLAFKYLSIGASNLNQMMLKTTNLNLAYFNADAKTKITKSLIHKTNSAIYVFMIGILLMIASVLGFYFCDWQFIACAYALIFYLLRNRQPIIQFGIAAFSYYLISTMIEHQLINQTLVGALFILFAGLIAQFLYTHEKGEYNLKYFFYIYYPAHILILTLLA